MWTWRLWIVNLNYCMHVWSWMLAGTQMVRTTGCTWSLSTHTKIQYQTLRTSSSSGVLGNSSLFRFAKPNNSKQICTFHPTKILNERTSWRYNFNTEIIIWRCYVNLKYVVEFTEYSVKYIHIYVYNVWHLWEANNCYRVLSKNLGYIHIYIYIWMCEGLLSAR